MAKEITVRFDEPLPETIEIDGVLYSPDWIEVSTLDDYAKNQRVFIPGILGEPLRIQ